MNGRRVIGIRDLKSDHGVELLLVNQRNVIDIFLRKVQSSGERWQWAERSTTRLTRNGALDPCPVQEGRPVSNSTRTRLTMLGASDDKTLMGVPALSDIATLQADIAAFGAPCCSLYLSAAEYAHANLDGPKAIREALATWVWAHDRYDWDQGDYLYEDMNERVVDLGDLPVDMASPERNRQVIQDTCTVVIEKGAIPFALGGDDSIPLPMLWVLERLEDITILQLMPTPIGVTKLAVSATVFRVECAEPRSCLS